MRIRVRVIALAALLSAVGLGQTATAAAAAVVHPNCIWDPETLGCAIAAVTPASTAGASIRTTPHIVDQPSNVISTLPYGQTETVTCHGRGDSVNGDVLWDFVRYDGHSGYVAESDLITQHVGSIPICSPSLIGS